MDGKSRFSGENFVDGKMENFQGNVAFVGAVLSEFLKTNCGVVGQGLTLLMVRFNKFWSLWGWIYGILTSQCFFEPEEC